MHPSDITLHGGFIQANVCQETGCAGGGLYANAMLALTSTQVLSNISEASGGGIYATGAVTLVNGVFQDNQCLVGGCSGGGLRAVSTLTLNGTQFLGNSSRSNGGGAYSGGAANVQGAVFQDNQCTQAGCSGGGLYAKNGLGLFSTLLVNNTAQANGGGLAQAGGSGQVVNSLFARNNTLGGNGSAMYLASPGTATILYDTIASPTLGSGAAIGVVAGTVGITDTIITSYTTGISLTAGTVYQDYNLFFGVPLTATTGVSGAVHSLTGAPAFRDPAHDDYHLTAGSAAVGKGVDVGITTDIDGDTRPSGAGFDIGFDELPVPIAVAQAFGATKNTPLVVPAPGLLANDSPGGPYPLTALLASGPATGTLVLAPTGAFTYTPAVGFTGPVTFTYRADNTVTQSLPAVVTITVNAKVFLPLVRR